jgi:hypothetical protein
MNNVHFPIQVVALFRRLVNVMATFSLSGQYLISKVRAEDTSSNTSEVHTTVTSNDFWWNPLSPNKWDWLRVGLFVDTVLERPTKPLTSTLPHWTSEGKSLRLAFTSVHQTHAVVRKQADASLRTIPSHGLQIYLPLIPKRHLSLIPQLLTHSLSIPNCHRGNYHLENHPRVIPLIPSIAYCKIQHCMTRSEPLGFPLSSATVSPS